MQELHNSIQAKVRTTKGINNKDRHVYEKNKPSEMPLKEKPHHNNVS